MPPDVRIIVVGGDLEAYLVALFLCHTYPQANLVLVDKPPTQLTLPAMTAGPSVVSLFARLKIAEESWMRETGATYHFATRLDHFFSPQSHFWQSLEEIPHPPHQTLSAYLAAYCHYQKLAKTHASDELIASVPLLQEGLIPRRLRCIGSPDYLAMGETRIYFPYGYHLDSEKTTHWLKRQLIRQPQMRWVGADSVSVELRKDRSIAHLILPTGEEIQGDLFMDCTGRALHLLSQVTPLPIASPTPALLCDQLHVDYRPYMDPEKEMVGYMHIKAQNNGWNWAIPLSEGWQVGSISSSAFTSQDKSTRFLSHRLLEPWAKNCLAIGSSAACFEPLGISPLDLLASSLLQFPQKPLAAVYNKYFQGLTQAAYDYISAHYLLTSREETPFWQTAKFGSPSDSLLDRLESQRQGHYRHSDLLVPPWNWIQLFFGMNVYPTPPTDCVGEFLHFSHCLEAADWTNLLRESRKGHWPTPYHFIQGKRAKTSR